MTRSTETARRLRRSANVPEQRAWQTLRAFRKLGYPVRRQYQIDSYFVDFAVTKAMLVIEIDGGVHNIPEVKARDKKRQAHLEAIGWRVLRVPTDVALSKDHLFGLVQSYLETDM